MPSDLSRDDWLGALPRALVAGFVKTDKDFQNQGIHLVMLGVLDVTAIIPKKLLVKRLPYWLLLFVFYLSGAVTGKVNHFGRTLTIYLLPISTNQRTKFRKCRVVKSHLIS